MDIEQLKLILETLQAAGEGASDLFVLWLVLDKLVPTFGWLATFGGMVWIAKYITDAVRVASAIDTMRYMGNAERDRVIKTLLDAGCKK